MFGVLVTAEAVCVAAAPVSVGEEERVGGSAAPAGGRAALRRSGPAPAAGATTLPRSQSLRLPASRRPVSTAGNVTPRTNRSDGMFGGGHVFGSEECPESNTSELWFRPNEKSCRLCGFCCAIMHLEQAVTRMPRRKLTRFVQNAHLDSILDEVQKNCLSWWSFEKVSGGQLFSTKLRCCAVVTLTVCSSLPDQ